MGSAFPSRTSLRGGVFVRTAQATDQTANPDVDKLIGLAIARRSPECQEERGSDTDASYVGTRLSFASASPERYLTHPSSRNLCKWIDQENVSYSRQVR